MLIVYAILQFHGCLISIKKIDNPQKSISYIYSETSYAGNPPCNVNDFEIEPGMYEIKITTNKKSIIT